MEEPQLLEYHSRCCCCCPGALLIGHKRVDAFVWGVASSGGVVSFMCGESTLFGCVVCRKEASTGQPGNDVNGCRRTTSTTPSVYYMSLPAEYFGLCMRCVCVDCLWVALRLGLGIVLLCDCDCGGGGDYIAICAIKSSHAGGLFLLSIDNQQQRATHSHTNKHSKVHNYVHYI